MESTPIMTLFRTGRGPDWPTYLGLLQRMDREWRSSRVSSQPFGVFGPRPSWQDTIARAQYLFEADDWMDLDQDQCSLIAPAEFYAHGDALLGSIGRRSTAVRNFLFDPDHAQDRDTVLERLKYVQRSSGAQVAARAGTILAELRSLEGMGTAFASRLLALARPDWFVVVNNKSRKWLADATGLRLTGKTSYQNLIAWVADQAWHASPEPNDPWERSIWGLRAALLDAFAYHPARG
ncbi:MAG TPA: hypothetical protein VGB88_04340 [Alphaproteobacteria bacterium]